MSRVDRTLAHRMTNLELNTRLLLYAELDALSRVTNGDPQALLSIVFDDDIGNVIV
jgi:hypothetical protein